MAMMDQKDRRAYLLGLKIAGDFGATIAIPVVVFVLIGKWLDARAATAPRYMILGFIVAALMSANIIYRKAKRYGKQYQNEILESDKQSKGTRLL